MVNQISIDNYYTNIKQLTNTQKMVYDEFCKFPDMQFTPSVMASRLDEDILNIRPRFSELKDLGLINYLVPHEDLEKKAFELARRIAEGPPLALGSAKKLLNKSLNFSVEEMLEIEAQSQAACMQSEDHMEGIAAFYEKRKSHFRGK